MAANKRRWALAAVIALLSGFGAARWFASPGGDRRPALLDLPVVDLDGGARTVEYWRGRLTLVNFWATWCAPCREEVPLLTAFHSEWGARGVRIIGVAVDEAEAVRRFRDELDVRYPLVVVGGEAVRWMAAYGNPSGGLPVSVLLDARGEAAHVKLGAYRPAELRSVLTRAVAASGRPKGRDGAPLSAN